MSKKIFIIIIIGVLPTILLATGPEFYTSDSIQLLKWLYYTPRSDDSLHKYELLNKQENEKLKKIETATRRKKNSEKRTKQFRINDNYIIVNDSILYSGSQKRGFLVFSPRIGKKYTTPAPVKWIIGIVSDTIELNSTIKIFSGGELPPNSIMWFGETSDGRTVDTGNYYCRMVILDSKLEFHQTSWIHVFVQR